LLLSSERNSYQQRPITIPAQIRNRLHLKAGDVLEFDENAPFLKASKAISPEAWEQFGKNRQDPWSRLDSMAIHTALLFAAALEQASLNPLIVMTKDHALVGVWLQPQEFPQLLNDEASSVRKRIERLQPVSEALEENWENLPGLGPRAGATTGTGPCRPTTTGSRSFGQPVPRHDARGWTPHSPR